MFFSDFYEKIFRRKMKAKKWKAGVGKRRKILRQRKTRWWRRKTRWRILLVITTWRAIMCKKTWSKIIFRNNLISLNLVLASILKLCHLNLNFNYFNFSYLMWLVLSRIMFWNQFIQNLNKKKHNSFS